MYIQGMAQQTQVFLLCTGFGFAAGALYDVIRLVRKSFFKGIRAVAAQDIIFFIVLTPAAFFFMLCINDGELRFYPYFGMAAGFFIWYFTLGTPVKCLFDKLSVLIFRIFRPVFVFTKEIFKKTIKNIKKSANKLLKPLEKSADNSV